MTVSRIRPELNLLTITPKRPLIVALDVQRRRLERPQRIQNLNKTPKHASAPGDLNGMILA